ncbi:uncharacterized protein AKAW2_50413A [Aspergillus luchuensis]|uniref:C2H2-type domain-containing protein n=1 Tax=Aspergillus kawachii TaxID=1069201 RepID=A0A7R8A080_ASPKA|nr:uncharacterized protein AKAW2_50413A [Aspergillus luchuensis]BCS00072.1 hypothetical protein AKAW2_50413A [Aspergillus luchuensis]
MAQLKPYPCPACNKSFKTRSGARAHVVDVHYLQCPQCPKRFESTISRMEHQKSKGHFQCFRCQHVSQGAAGCPTQCLPNILVQSVALSGAQPSYCSDCDKTFVDATALRQHLQDKVHVKLKEKALRDCKKCNKSFVSTTALRQHEQSTSHKPLAELRCVAESCRLTFNTPSALIHHLESGRCPSGWSRQTVNAILHGYDKDRIITKPVMLLDMSFMSATLSPSNSSFSDIVCTPAEWSEIDSDGEMERSPIAPSPPGVDHGPLQQRTLSCPICSSSGRKRIFADQVALEMHISSAAHAGKAFKCPVAFTTHATSPNARTKSFTTLSGLTQHLESGRCQGGKSTLWKTMDYLQNEVFRFEWPGRLLRG